MFLPAACVDVTEVPLENGTLELYDDGDCRFEFNDLAPGGPNPRLVVRQGRYLGKAYGEIKLIEPRRKKLPKTLDLLIGGEWVLTTDLLYDSSYDCVEMPSGTESCYYDPSYYEGFLRIPLWQLGNLLAQVDGPVEIEFRSSPGSKRGQPMSRFRYRLPAGFGEGLKTHMGVCNRWRELHPAAE